MEEVQQKKRRKLGKAYAARLSAYSNKGECGLPEVESPTDVLDLQIDTLAKWVSQSPYVVVHTGAGISTAAGIPDFRGSNGVWTQEKRGEKLASEPEKCWDNAVPTLGHMAVLGLVNEGIVKAVVSQNVDGLHLRSGVPRNKLSELHGNIFEEECMACGIIQQRSFDVGTVGFRATGRTCRKCSCRLKDRLLDWNDALPEPDYSLAQEHSTRTEAPGGLSICLGTSLQMEPARNLPLQADRMVIVNLQSTPLDDQAAAVIRGRIDDVMQGLMARLKVAIPLYDRRATFSVISESRVVSKKHMWCLTVGEDDGTLPCGYLSSVHLSFPDAGLSDVHLTEQPFSFKSRFSDRNVVRLCCRIEFEDVPGHARPEAVVLDRQVDPLSRTGWREDISCTLVRVQYEPAPPAHHSLGNALHTDGSA